MATTITAFTKGRVIMTTGRRYDFDHAETRPPNERTGFPAHVRIKCKDGALQMLFWPAIAEIIEDKPTG
jgi:hypothetical protein